MRNRLCCGIVGSLLVCLASAALGATAELPITYQLGRDGNVSVAVYDANGRMVREVLRAEPQKSGEHRQNWDGLDQAGKPVPLGQYTWKLLQTQGLEAEYLLSIGTSFRELHWPSQHGGPSLLAAAGDDVFVGGSPEGSPLITKMSLEGQYRWALGKFEIPGTLDMSCTPQQIALIQSTGTTYLLRTEDGSRIGGFTALMPLRRLDLAGPEGMCEPGFTSVPLEAYSKERGYGWENTDGMVAQSRVAREALHSGFHGSTTVKEKTFLVDVPNGWYLVRVHAGDNDRDTATMKYIVQGREVLTEAVKQGQSASLLVPQAYKTPSPVEVTDGQLKIKFAVSDKSERPNWAIDGIEVLTMAQRADLLGGVVALCYPNLDMVQWRDTTDGSLLGTAKAPHPVDVAATSPPHALVICGDTVVAVAAEPLDAAPTTQPATLGSPAAVCIKGLTSPSRLSVDHITGDIFIAEGGDSQQIKRFDNEYHLLNTYGRKGGRRQGLYVPEDFLAVADVVGDGKGGFLIVEGDCAPRRTAHFDSSGKLLAEWYGGQLFYTYFAPDPENPNYVWLDSQWGWIMQAEVDYEKKTWKPRATYRFANLAEGMVPGKHNGPGGWQVRHHEGQTYLVKAQGAPCILHVDEAKGQLVPVMASATNITHYWDAQSKFVQGLLNNDRRSKWLSYIWTDQNNDGQPQPPEVKLSTWSNWGPGWSIDNGFNYYQTNLDRKTNTYELRRMDPTGWQGPVPLYDGFDAAKVSPLSADGSRMTADNLPSPVHAWRDQQGNVYQILHGGGDGFFAASTYPATHGYAWPANGADATMLAKWDALGKVQWQVGPHAARPDNPKGQLHFPIRIVGTINGCVGVADKIVQPCEFWTEDGLYVGGLFDRRANDGLPDRVYAWWRADRSKGDDFEKNLALFQYDMLIGGTLAKRPNGDVLFYGAGWNNVPVYRIRGWDQFSRQEGALTVAAESAPAPANGWGLDAEYFASPDLSGEPTLRQVDPRIWFDGPKVARKAMPWPQNPVTNDLFSARWTGQVEPRFTEAHTFFVYLGTDPKRMAEPVRLWVNDELVIDTWDKPDQRDARPHSKPIALTAGQKVPIRLEYRRTGNGSLHLCWESLTQPIAHIPATALYARQRPTTAPATSAAETRTQKPQ